MLHRYLKQIWSGKLSQGLYAVVRYRCMNFRKCQRNSMAQLVKEVPELVYGVRRVKQTEAIKSCPTQPLKMQ